LLELEILSSVFWMLCVFFVFCVLGFGFWVLCFGLGLRSRVYLVRGWGLDLLFRV